MEKSKHAPLYLEAPAPTLSPAQAGDGQARQRTFSGIAYSGEPIRYWGSPLVIDLASLILPNQCPVLIQHDRDKRVGVCTLAVRDGALTCDGYLLANEDAMELAADADGGFPFQLSVHAEPGSVEEVKAGTQVKVNGRALAGPLVIYRQTRIRELSFTPTGVDYRTEAHVLSATPLSSAQSPEAHTMPDPNPLESQVADMAAQVADLTAQLATATTRAEAADATLADLHRATRLAAVTETFNKLGRTPAEAESEVYLSLPDTAWEQVAKDLLAAKPAAPAHLFSEQATGDPAAPPPTPSLNLSAIYAARREVTQ